MMEDLVSTAKATIEKTEAKTEEIEKQNASAKAEKKKQEENIKAM